MKNVVYDRVTEQIKGYDRDPLPFELSLEIPYPVNLQKTVTELTGNMVQKVNGQGELLYKKDIVNNEFARESYTETTEARTVTVYASQVNTYRVSTDQTTTELQDVIQPDGTAKKEEVEVPIYDTITPTSEVPIEWEDHEAIMIEETVERTYTLEQNCFIFTADEITEAITNTIPVKPEVQVTAERVSATEDAIMILMDMSLMM